MTVHSNSSLVPDVLPGLAHRTLAGAEHGLERLAIWSQSIDPRGATPPHFHDCEEVILVQRGEGTVAALSTANVVVRLPDGTPLDLPWK